MKSIGILLVDDQAFMRNLVHRMLTTFGIVEVHHATGGEQALLKIRNGLTPLDLIICDLKMPDMDGFGFVEALRKLPVTSAAVLPVLVLTGNATEENIETAIRLGVHGFIAKPVNATTLQERITRVLADPTMIDRDGFVS